MRIFIHRKKAHTHEAQLESIKTQVSDLNDRVLDDRDKAATALTVLTDQISRLNRVSSELRSIGA